MTSQTSVNFYQTTEWNIPEDSHLLRSYVVCSSLPRLGFAISVPTTTLCLCYWLVSNYVHEQLTSHAQLLPVTVVNESRSMIWMFEFKLIDTNCLWEWQTMTWCFRTLLHILCLEWLIETTKIFSNSCWSPG
jgi:hypothetical protein